MNNNKSQWSGLIKASQANLVDFGLISSDPISIQDTESIEYSNLKEIKRRYEKCGLVVLDLKFEYIDESTVIKLGNMLDLGNVFIPPLYRKGKYKTKGISEISTKDNAVSHPAFQREEGIKFHCDGTLQDIGYIKTSILLCKTPATRGGDSTLFNATAAYAELLKSDLDAAIAMATHGSLVRQANLNDCSDKNIGPVFATKDGKLICAYSVTKTDQFIATKGIQSSDLNRGIDFMKKASQPGSKYFHQLKLQANQALVFANSKIAHGRMPFCNSKNMQRCLYRGLYLRKPVTQPSDKLK